MLGYSSFISFVILFVCGVLATIDEDIKANKQARKLQETKSILEIFEFHYDHILQKPFPRQTYGPLYREYININDDYNEKTTDPEILEEFKEAFFYFHASTPANTSINRILANYHVTHIATWFKLNFQTCSLFYTTVQKNEEIRKNCERIATFLETFTSILPQVQAYQYASFRKESPKNVKITERSSSSQTEIISQRLKKAIKVEDISDPDIKQCNERKYCEIWIKKLKEQPKSFKLNHILFDVYNGFKESDYNVYDFDSYTSDHEKSITLWNHTSELLQKVDKVQLENKKDNKITSYAVTILLQLIDFKISEFGVDPYVLMSTEMPTENYYTETLRIFSNDEM